MKPTKPYLLKDGRRTIYRGTRSQCMTKMLVKDGDDLKVVRNPKFKWLKGTK